MDCEINNNVHVACKTTSSAIVYIMAGNCTWRLTAKGLPLSRQSSCRLGNGRKALAKFETVIVWLDVGG